MVKKIQKIYQYWAKTYDSDAKENPAIKAVGNLLIKPIPVGSKVLDYGCGTGRAISYLLEKKCKIVGLDISKDMLKIAKNRFGGKVKFVYWAGKKLPFKEESFDVVHASLIVNHLNNLKYFFKECWRVLKRGGLLVYDCSVSNVINVKQPFIPKYHKKRKEPEHITKLYKELTPPNQLEEHLELSTKQGFILEFYKTTIIDSEMKEVITPISYKENKGKKFWSIFYMRKK